MRRRLVQALVATAAGVSLALGLPMLALVSNDQHAALISRLQVQTMVSASVLSSQPTSAWSATVERVAAETGARVVVVDRDLTLLADSDNSSLDRSFNRPEIEQALAGQLTSDVRWSNTLAEELRYVAAPILNGQQVIAAVRLSIPDDEVDAAIRNTQIWLAAFVISVVAIAAVVAFWLARSISQPLRSLAAVARALPEDLSLRAKTSVGPIEVQDVAVALNSTADRLEGLVERSERVAAEASHHLRTPLTGLRLRLEAIEETAKTDDVAAQAAAANAEVMRLARRIDQILQLARSDAASDASAVEYVTDEVADRISAAEKIAEERGIELRAELAPDIFAMLPPGVVPRTVDELLGNAMQYAKSIVDVRLNESNGFVRLSVADDGPGVAENELETIWSRFARGSNAVPGGSGLGLAMVAEAAAAAGGSATARRSDLGGLAIEVSWPAAEL